ncbi:lycopene cyclase [Nocardia mangyaensis]|uniref:Lycopene cyclase n=1 Tax=Nocardia mangyaensis TaxID=2213200 RepID=A0A1J0VUD5_9NOCA|nr:lycopene cyclase family protein [Nocardia mangyaensis]APE35667.1 lycopene cyclase [Nocardia mangyaensis]
MRTDLIICGLGPAGRAVAHRALAAGQSVTVIDPHPDRVWTPTYAAWADELPGWLDSTAVAATVAAPTAWAVREHRIERAYRVLDTAALHSSLTLDGARVLADRVVAVEGRATVRTATGLVHGGRVIDARGLSRSPRRAEQTAYGVVLGRDVLVDRPALFMDWRLDNGAAPDEPPSFLYVVPLGPDTVLYEETCLAGRPALSPAALRRRLEHRLRERGIPTTGSEPVERVRFPVHGGKPGRGRFGAAGGLTHPATGYSVATSLRAADTVVAGARVWTPDARAVAALRHAGLRSLLAFPPRDVAVFFDAFFALPAPLQRAYLSGHDDLRGTVAAMRALFTALPPRLRRTLVTAVLGLGGAADGARSGRST